LFLRFEHLRFAGSCLPAQLGQAEFDQRRRPPQLLVNSPVMMPVLRAIGYMPSAVMVGAGFAIGAATSWTGWNAGKRPQVPAAQMQAA